MHTAERERERDRAEKKMQTLVGPGDYNIDDYVFATLSIRANKVQMAMTSSQHRDINGVYANSFSLCKLLKFISSFFYH